MYLAHFGLDRAPFAITPDPRFVYLTPRHREALAHLLFGLGEGGGFVQLTGEVGTGKTTICRTLLRQLPENVDAALIFNPQLTVQELLEGICTELHIERPSAGLSIKALTDLLYAHLLEANARGRRTVLIIDEAQNLAPDLLEEVRLLTNLETDDSKLLQVFLIGQPELRSKLAGEGLRQLAQRITARYHLEPLDAEETLHYVRHRLRVAGCTREIFTPAAARRVHRLCEGIPRRINILCDRALLGAYAVDGQQVGPQIVERANAEIQGRPARRRARAAAVAAVLALVAGAVLVMRDAPPVSDWLRGSLAVFATPAQPASVSAPTIPAPAPTPAIAQPEVAIADSPSDPAPDSPAVATAEQAPSSLPAPPVAVASTEAGPAAMPPPATSEPVSSDRLASALLQATAQQPGPPNPEPAARPAPGPDLEALLAAADDDGWRGALDALASLWGVAAPREAADPCAWARGEGLECHRQTASLPALRGLGLPAVLRLTSAEGTARYALLRTLSGDAATVLVAGRSVSVPLAELERTWRGEFFLLWRPPLASAQTIRYGQGGPRVRWLRETLAAIDGVTPSAGGGAPFDDALLARVKDFQRRRGLVVDGIVGPQTLMNLAQASSVHPGPSLARRPAAEATVGPAAALAERGR